MNNDNTIMTDNEDIECVNLLKNSSDEKYCKYLSEKIGKEFKTCSELCKKYCFQNGPHNGKLISKQQEKQFIIKSIEEYDISSLESVKQIIDNYNSFFDIAVPNFYIDIVQSLSFLNKFKGFKKFTLTGECIKNSFHSDLKSLDIVLWFDSMEDFINQNVESELPKLIKNINTNFFIYTGDIENVSSVVYPQLDVENRSIYKSNYFDMQIRGLQLGLQVQEPIKQENTTIQIDNLEKNIKEKPQPKLGWGLVAESWHKASQFMDAASSRGLISTVLDYTGIDNKQGERVSDEIYNLRRESCFGNTEKNTPPCQFLSKDVDDMYFCKGCGCGTNKLAVLNPTEENGYSKLHYPNLECPLAKPGFSNHIE